MIKYFFSRRKMAGTRKILVPSLTFIFVVQITSVYGKFGYKYLNKLNQFYDFPIKEIITISSCTSSGNIIHGGWTPWSVISPQCTKSCGIGKQEKIRTCTNPEPQNGGRTCQNTLNQPVLEEKKLFDCNVESCWSE